MTRYNNILETIGRTPLVRLQKMAPDHVNMYVKVESFNPMGSVKDRMALAMIEAAEASGELKPGQTVIEATSGNTGIGLAMVCAAKGYPLVVTMAESFSVERRKMLRFLGAKVVLTPASEKGTGMLNKAVELAEEHGYYLCRQFENEANATAHTRTTAQEILQDFARDFGRDVLTGPLVDRQFDGLVNCSHFGGLGGARGANRQRGGKGQTLAQGLHVFHSCSPPIHSPDSFRVVATVRDRRRASGS